jgi:P27 family predicted phage terminase small subunit
MFERKSDELHDLHGTSARTAPENSVQGQRPRCPKELTPEEKKIFRATVRELEKRRTCTSGDVEIIRLLAVKISQLKRALAHLAAEGEVVIYTRLDKKGNPVESHAKNLWLGIAQEAEGKITSLLDRLGFTPLNRPRIRPTKDEGIAGVKFL